MKSTTLFRSIKGASVPVRTIATGLLNRITKSLLTASAGLACLDLFGQGTVHFAVNSSTPIINALSALPVKAADGIKAALYWSPLGSSNFVQIGEAVDVGVPVSGVFVGGTRTTRQATLGGARAQFQVRAWEAACGDTYEQAMAAPAQGGRRALVGQSAILEVPTGNANPPTPPAVLTAYGLQSFQVNPASRDLEPLATTVGRSPAGFGINCPTNLSFQVWSPESGTLNYRIDIDAAWLSVDPRDGSSSGGTNRHQITVTSLPGANCIGTILITPLVEGGKPQSVIVSAPDARGMSRPIYSALGYRFVFSGQSGRQYLTEFSTNLFDWLPLQTNQLQGTELEVFDTSAGKSSMRFYRTRPLP